MNEEPSVLDYVKSRLMPWRKAAPTVSSEAGSQQPDSLAARMESEVIPEQTSEIDAVEDLRPAVPPPAGYRLPWRSVSALFLAILAQWMLEPRPNPDRWQLALMIYLGAGILMGWAIWRKEWLPSPLPSRSFQIESLRFNLPTFIIGIIFLGLAYILFGSPFIDNRFNTLNVLLWLAGTALAAAAIWQKSGNQQLFNRIQQASTWLQKPSWDFRLSKFHLLWIAVFAVCIYFRFNQLVQVPPEMNSDHAEKLLDVMDVLHGDYSIFFPRNTGREPLQFYLIALTIRIFGTGVSFLSMKIGTAFAGIAVLPFIYLIGKELANREAGLLAMAFAGIAYWPNVLSRVALRFSLYPLFVAPALYYLIRGLRSGRTNDFILSGLFLGLGLLGYTPIRILPFVIAIAVLLAALHMLRSNRWKPYLSGLIITAFFTFAAALPLLRYAQDHPETFAYRAFSRLTDMEKELPQPAGIIFLDNLKNAMLMYGWNDGQIWPISIPGRPALDVISAALFYLGLFMLLVRYLRHRKWEDLFLILAVPLLMLPSILSLAYPAENPAPNRAGGAMVPVFIVIGLSLEGFLKGLRQRITNNPGGWMAGLLAIILFTLSASQNYDLVFRQYKEQYGVAAWNSSEMGQVLTNFAAAGGELDATWVVKSSHWVDTRLVGMHAGDPERDFGIDLENIPLTVIDIRPKLFLVRHFTREEDRAVEKQTLALLQQTYPLGWAQLYASQYPDKDFWMFFTPPAIPGIQAAGAEENTTP